MVHAPATPCLVCTPTVWRQGAKVLWRCSIFCKRTHKLVATRHLLVLHPSTWQHKNPDTYKL